MKTPTLFIAVVITSLASIGFADEKNEKGGSSFWAKKKLDYTTNIPAGMPKGDFKEIEEQAQAMRFVNRLEGMVRQQPPEYRNHLRSFRSAIDELEHQATSRIPMACRLPFNN